MTDVATIEADQQTGSTPAAPEPSQAAPIETQQPTSQAPAASVPEVAGGKVDRDAAAFERLQAGESAKAIRQSLDAAEPSTVAAKEGTPQSQPARTADGKFAPAKPEPAVDAKADAANFGDLSANELQALRRTQLLPDAETWKATPTLVRASIIQQAQRIAQAQGRISQQMGQNRQQQNNGADSPEAVNLAGKAPPSTDPIAGQFQRQPDGTPASRAQQPAQAPPIAQPVTEVDPFAGFTAYFGEEVAQPIRQQFGAQQQVIQQLQQQLQQRGEAHAAETQWLAQQVFLPQEQEALKELRANVPTAFKSPEDLNRLRAQAGVYFDACREGSNPCTWREATLWAGRAMIQPDAQQAAQQALLKNSSRSLASSPSRPELKGPVRQMSREDKDAYAMRLLEAGHSAREVNAKLGE